MKPDYAEAELPVGPPAADKPKEDTGWIVQWSEPGSLPALAPGGTVSALVCVERGTSPRSTARLVGKASSKAVALAFAPTTVVVDAWRGSRALVECRITTATGVVGVVKITLWAEDA